MTEKKRCLSPSLEEISRWAVVAGLLLTALGLMLSVRDGVQNRQLERLMFTADIVRRFDTPEVVAAARVLKDEYKSLTAKAEERPLSPSEAECIFYPEKALDPERSRTIRASLHTVLDYWEDVGLAIEQGIAIEPVVRRSLEGAMTRYYRVFAAYIQVASKDRGEPEWAPFQSVAKRWIAQPVKQSENQQK